MAGVFLWSIGGPIPFFAIGSRTMFSAWFGLAIKTARLGFEAQSVIALRLMRLAAGGSVGHAEASRMVSEKYSTLAEAQMIATTSAVAGRPPDVVAGKILRTYRKRVRANKRRLAGR